MDAEAPDILVGVVAQTGAQVPQGALREIGVVVLAANLLKMLLRIHAVEVDGVIQVVVQMLKVAGSRHSGQVQHGIVVGSQVQVAVIDPQVAGHGVVDAQAKAVLAVVADDLCPGEGTVRQLFTPVHGKALLVGDAGAGIGLVCDHSHVEVAVVRNDIPNAAAVEAVNLHHSRQALKIILVGDDPPGIQRGAGIRVGYNDAARGPLAIVVVCSQAHEDFSIINQQPMHTVGHATGSVDVVVHNVGLVGGRVDLNQSRCGVAHARKVQLPLELKHHPVTGQVVFHRHRRRIAWENVGILTPDLPLPENHLGFACDLMDRHNHRRPVAHQSGVKRIHAKGNLDNLIRNFPGVELRVQKAGVLHAVQGGLYIVVIDVVRRIVTSANVYIVSGLCHGPGIALPPVLFLPREDPIHFPCAQGGMGYFVNGITTIGEDPLFIGLVTDVPVLVGVDAVIGQRRCRQQAHYQEQ